MSSRRAWVRLESAVVGPLGGRVAEGGGESIKSRREGLSRVLPSSEEGDAADKGVIGRGLSGDGVRGSARRGGAFGLSLRKGPSMMIFVVWRVSTRASMEKEAEELIRNMGVGISCMVAGTSLLAVRERGGGRSGERAGRGGEFE